MNILILGVANNNCSSKKLQTCLAVFVTTMTFNTSSLMFMRSNEERKPSLLTLKFILCIGIFIFVTFSFFFFLFLLVRHYV